MALRIIVRGRVQGVGFRYFTKQAARSMGIVGEVWNRSDGGVEIIAEHADPAVLEVFHEVVEKGPGYIRDIQMEPAPDRGFSEFAIGLSR